MISGTNLFISRSSVENNYVINHVSKFPKNDSLVKDIKEVTLHSKGKVLIVEDSIFNQKYLQAFISSFGYNVVIVDNGKDASELTLVEKFDFILMDIEMPIMDGYEATLKIRNNKNCNHKTPIILQTSINDETKLSKFTKIFDDKISKPYKKEEIRQVMEKLLLTVTIAA